ncbi:hypothetical protein DEO72_LG8g2846 [Vigna unguiculata]|uniref:Uncharacterized protein n=1 Tax=Vigna unguiculata TaxID=3917 RepID=A0A4D6MY49_VIGUN|nr:hypothetical protein DEO72_LG8g2846 [Vigna unguiculata]
MSLWLFGFVKQKVNCKRGGDGGLGWRQCGTDIVIFRKRDGTGYVDVEDLVEVAGAGGCRRSCESAGGGVAGMSLCDVIALGICCQIPPCTTSSSDCFLVCSPSAIHTHTH